MKIYLSTKFQNVEIYGDIKNSCEELGHSITCDWVKHKDYKSIDKNERINQSNEDLKGIELADLIILIYTGKDYEPGKGTMFEIGYASALQKPIIGLDLSQQKDLNNQSQFLSSLSKIVYSTTELYEYLQSSNLSNI